MTSLRTLTVQITQDVITMRHEEEGLDTSEEQLGPVNDKAAALFNMSLAFGNILAPIIGGWLVDKVGF